jgi:hypothetical protein
MFSQLRATNRANPGGVAGYDAVEVNPRTLGVIVEGHHHIGVVDINQGSATGNMAPELLAERSYVGGQKKRAGNLPKTISKSPRTFLLTKRRKSYPQGGFMVGYHALPRGNHRIA